MAGPVRAGGLVAGDASVQLAGACATTGTDKTASTAPPVHFAIFMGLSPSISVTLSEALTALQTPHTHRRNIIHPHGFLHHERLSVLHSNQIAVEPSNGAQPLPDFLPLR